MSYSRQYLKFVESEYKVGKGMVKPRNIYKIQSYEYADGSTKTLTGPNSNYIFVFGIFNKKLLGIKFTEVSPDRFKVWFKTLFRGGLTESDIDNAKELSELIKKSGRDGSEMFSSHIKGKPIYEGKIETYRTYNIESIKQIKIVNLNKDYIKLINNITPTPLSDKPNEDTNTQ
jgi:hypothetical protein